MPAAHSVAGKQIDFAYDASGLFKQIDRYADAAGTEYVASSHYQYDGMGRLAKLVHSTTTTPPPTGTSWGSGVLSGYRYAYDDASRLTNINLKIGSFTGNASYSYDETGQVVGDGQTGPWPVSFNNLYYYDANGNRTSQTIGLHNQLLSDGTYDYTYDAEGNRTSKTHLATGRMTAYAYDHRNRLTSATDWLVGPYPADDGAGTGWGVHPTSDSTTSLGDPNAGQYATWGWGPSYATGATAGGTIAFEATVTSATEGNNVVLTLSASSSVQLEFWAEDYSAQFMAGDYWMNGSGTATVTGSPTQVTFGTGENSLYSPTKSFVIRVRAVGDPSSEIILEADVYNDDALTFGANAAPAVEGNALRLNVWSGAWGQPLSGAEFEWWIEDVSATLGPWYHEHYYYESTEYDYYPTNGVTSGQFTDGGYIDIHTYASPQWFELTESFKIHVQIKNVPSSKLILEGRILDRDPMRYEDAGVAYKYDTANQLVTREFDLDGPAGPETAQKTYYAYNQGQIVLQFDGNTVADLSHRYTWGPQVDQLLADEAVDNVFAAGNVLWPLADHLGTIRDIAIHNSTTHVTTVANHPGQSHLNPWKSRTGVVRGSLHSSRLGVVCRGDFLWR